MRSISNGVYAARKTDGGVKCVYIEEEILEQRYLNALTRERNLRRERQERERANANLKLRREAAAAEEKSSRERQRLVRRTLKLLGVATAVFVGHQLGLVALGFALPVWLVLLVSICFRAGRWYGRRGRTSK